MELRGLPSICIFYHWIVTQTLLTGLFAASMDRQGPSFRTEPPHRVDFLNSSGAIIPCTATGKPTPQITWIAGDGSLITDVPGLRHVRSDGALVFPPFRAEDYRQDVHAVTYRCLASNILGKIGSRDVGVRAVVAQLYEVQVFDEFALRGNSAMLKCHIPAIVKDFVSIIAWIRDDGFLIQRDGTQGKYTVLPSGELHIRNVEQQDGFRGYRCQTKHRLTGETKLSVTSGQLIVTEPHSNSAPRLVHHIREVRVKMGEWAFLSCAARGQPVPSYRWYKSDGGNTVPIKRSSRIIQSEGILVFKQTTVQDSGKYVCVVNNSLGQEQGETVLTVAVPLGVKIIPSYQSATIGQSVWFNCSVSGYPIDSIKWMRNMRPYTGNEGVKISYGGHLSIPSVQKNDRGMYQCFVSNAFDSVQASAELALGDEAPLFENIFKEKTLHPGSVLSLSCGATGNPLPQITWKLDGLSLPDFIRFRTGDYVTRESRVISYVNVTNVRPEDGGVYSCTAKNGVGAIQHSARINVFGPAGIRAMPNVTVLAGASLELQCPAIGYPLANISWERDGRLLPLNHRQQVFPNGTLHLREVNRKADEGKYTCLVHDTKGSTASQDVHIQVIVGPKIDKFSFPTDLEEGMRSVAVCAVLAGDPPMSISWMKDWDTLPSNLHGKIELVNEFTSTLSFSAVGPEHSGNYTCIARNLAASANYTAQMVVNVPPFWKHEPTDKSGIMGQGVRIDCQAGGFPPPQVRWKRQQGEKASSFKTIISNPHIQILENGSLVIRDLKEDDSGEYMCQAFNGISPSLSAVIRLTVHVPAYFHNKYESFTVKKGDKVLLKCLPSGEKPLKIAWAKDRQPFNPQGDSRYLESQTIKDTGIVSQLTIISAERQDSALFSCIASNAYGNAEASFQVVVQERPDSPRSVQVKDVTSSSVTLSWIHPFSGNAPLTGYLVEYKRDTDEWSNVIESVSKSHTDTATIIRSLHPLSTYNFRVTAANTLGLGTPSEVVTVTTNEEAPTLPPEDVRVDAINSRSLKISWKKPADDRSRISIKGYYVGYRTQGSTEPYIFKTVEATGAAREEFVLSNLLRFTKYEIRIQAFNSAGSSPASPDQIVQTLEFDPPSSPLLRVQSTGATSVNLQWEKTDNAPVTGYQLYYKGEDGDWAEQQLGADHHTYILEGLQCGTRYQLYLTAFNDAGQGEPSDVISVKTAGTAPVAPDKVAFLTINSTSVMLNLEAWHSGGCPITSFVVQYKPQGDQDWLLVSNNVLPTTGRMILSELLPGSWYNLLMTAHNDAGSTDAEYVFSTLTVTGGTVPPLASHANQERLLYRKLSVIVPIACAVVIVVVVTIVICILHSRRRAFNRNSSQQDPSGDSQLSPTLQKEDSLTMSVLAKKTRTGIGYETPRECLYYPSPYATSRVPGCVTEVSGECDSLQVGTGMTGDSQRGHTYDVPFPVRRADEEEDQYSRIKRITVPWLPSLSVYQVSQYTDNDRQIGEGPYHRLHSSSSLSVPGYHIQQQQQIPHTDRWSSSYKWTSSRERSSKLFGEGRERLSDDEFDAEEGGINDRENEDDVHEISEAECDRDIAFSATKGDKQLQLELPAEIRRSTLWFAAVL